MEKLQRFFAEAGALGVGSVIFAFVLWIIAAFEHYKESNIPAFWFLIGGCISFCIGAFMAWSKADDRANERKPKLGFSADRDGFYLTHLKGDAAQFIEIETVEKRPDTRHGTKLSFDPLDFLGVGTTATLRVRLEVLPKDKKLADMGQVVGVMFSGWSMPRASFPIKIRFRWNEAIVEDTIVLTWISEEKRFETRPQ
jgi:hypothetical protein